MATKWSEYYAKRFLPWDTSRPSSQLISYFSSCLLERSHISAAASQLVQQATSAPVIVPPETTSDWINQPSVPVHVCKECHSSKPPAAGSVLELGCGTGASAVWLAKQVQWTHSGHLCTVFASSCPMQCSRIAAPEDTAAAPC